jgi:hypothetical protein
MDYTIVQGEWRSDVTVHVNGSQWQWLSNSSDTYFFVLTNSIRQEREFRRAWVMQTYIEPFDEVLSVRLLQRFDCANERSQQIQATTFSGSFGSGSVVASLPEDKWTYVQPGTVFESVATYVCSRKIASNK